MNFQQIQYFVAVAQCLNFSEAAKQLYVAQPALSYGIASLEKQLGTLLFFRDKRSVRLTPSGLEFLDEAVKILGHIERAYQKVNHSDESHSCELRVGFLGSLIKPYFHELIPTFLTQHSQIRVVLEQLNLLPLHTRLDDGDLDIGLTRSFAFEPNNECSHLRTQKLYDDKFMLLVHTGHPCAEMARISDMSVLESAPFIMVDPKVSEPLYRYTMKICARRNYIPKISYTPTVMDTIFTQVAAGMGISIVPYLNGYYTSVPGLHYVEIEGDDLCADVLAAWNPETENPAVPLFLDSLGIS